MGPAHPPLGSEPVEDASLCDSLSDLLRRAGRVEALQLLVSHAVVEQLLDDGDVPACAALRCAIAAWSRLRLSVPLRLPVALWLPVALRLPVGRLTVALLRLLAWVSAILRLRRRAVARGCLLQKRYDTNRSVMCVSTCGMPGRACTGVRANVGTEEENTHAAVRRVGARCSRAGTSVVSSGCARCGTVLLLLLLRGLTVLSGRLLAVLPVLRLLLSVAACLAGKGQTCACSGVLVHGLSMSRACQLERKAALSCPTSVEGG